MKKSSGYVFIATAATVFIIAKCASGPAPSQQVAESEATLRYAEIKAEREASRLNTAQLDSAVRHLDELGLSDQALLGCVKQNVEHALAHTGGTVLAQPTDIEKLDCTSKNIFRLNGLEHFKKLKHIDLAYNNIETLDPLGGLRSVKTLDLRHNKVGSIWSILGMDELETLKLTDNPVTDLHYLNGFDKLNQIEFKLTRNDRCDYLVSIKNALKNSRATLSIPSTCMDEFGEPSRLSEFE